MVKLKPTLKSFLKVKSHFDAAHKLEGYRGDCSNLHGHRWGVECTIKYSNVNDLGIAIDFKELKPLVNNELPDHRFLNDWMLNQVGTTVNPTAELIAEVLYSKISKKLEEKGLFLKALELWESPDCSVLVESNGI